ncbi:hypothetical protein [Autumnicola musiva]|uniref:Calx-beta domain-containing protein n=1 Tax=Autumnicola musiva TaxID=3075589 RepID=A0ABU3D8P7_9FLAO|nr:hypothetical protein [Zunongwangia sp. F117]MDT0677893.1 hypothetical protein [Zunongwangia sp. F117]
MKNLITRFTVIVMAFAIVMACSDDDSIPQNPIVKITGTSLNFGNVDVTESSQVRSYTIAAEDLSSPINISVEAPFYLSLDANGEFANSVSLSPDDFGNEATPVFVKFEPSSSDEGLMEKEIVHVSEDRDNIPNISVSGVATIPGEAMVTPDKASIEFGDVVIDQVSEIQSYILSGSELEGDIALEVTGPFTISATEDGEYSNLLSLSASDVIDNKVIYVRFEPTEEGDTTGTISHSSDDFDETVEIALSGTGEPLPAVSIGVTPTSLDFGAVPMDQSSEVLSYTLSGRGLNSEVAIEAPANFMISRATDAEFSEILTIPVEDFSSEVEIFVRFDSTGETGEKTGEITHTSADVEMIESVLLRASTLSAETKLFIEDFDYTAGAPLPSTDRTGDGTQNASMDGWLKVRAANTDIPVIDDGLSYDGYPGSGVGNAVFLDMDEPGSNSNVYAHNLSQQQNNEFAGAYYTSFLLKVDALPDDTGGGFNRTVMMVDWMPNGATKFLSSVQVNYNAGNPKIGVMYEGAFSLTDITPEVGETYLIVLKHNVPDADQANSNNSASVYIFEEGGLPAMEPEEADATIDIAETGDEFFVKAVTVVRDNSFSGAYVVDGIRVATLWNDLFE